MINNNPWIDQYLDLGHRWADANAAADLLEETKSAMLARMMLNQGDMPVNRAEMNVKASQEWEDFINSMVEARKVATHLQVNMKYAYAKHMEAQGDNATKRAEMRL